PQLLNFLGVGTMHLKRCQTVKLYIAGPLTFLYSHGAVWVFKHLIGYNIIAFHHVSVHFD
ncbi:hypothetical protein, partial [Escherichia coli]|uniref:hypothetical protein n=1 Tax=Escherichia coli TaxID=562 RepID=UPI00200D162C